MPPSLLISHPFQLLSNFFILIQATFLKRLADIHHPLQFSTPILRDVTAFASFKSVIVSKLWNPFASLFGSSWSLSASFVKGYWCISEPCSWPLSLFLHSLLLLEWVTWLGFLCNDPNNFAGHLPLPMDQIPQCWPKTQMVPLCCFSSLCHVYVLHCLITGA